jgi:hypothetical protein
VTTATRPRTDRDGIDPGRGADGTVIATVRQATAAGSRVAHVPIVRVASRSIAAETADRSINLGRIASSDAIDPGTNRIRDAADRRTDRVATSNGTDAEAISAESAGGSGFVMRAATDDRAPTIAAATDRVGIGSRSDLPEGVIETVDVRRGRGPADRLLMGAVAPATIRNHRRRSQDTAVRHDRAHSSLTDRAPRFDRHLRRRSPRVSCRRTRS